VFFFCGLRTVAERTADGTNVNSRACSTLNLLIRFGESWQGQQQNERTRSVTPCGHFLTCLYLWVVYVCLCFVSSSQHITSNARMINAQWIGSLPFRYEETKKNQEKPQDSQYSFEIRAQHLRIEVLSKLIKFRVLILKLMWYTWS
jgi:hypothetical protein